MILFTTVNPKHSYFFWITCSALLTAILYWRGLFGPFFLDDVENIAQTIPRNLNVTEILKILNGNTSGPTGRPVAVFSFMLNGFFFGFEPFAFKAVNLLIHLLNGLLVGVLTVKLLLVFNQTRSLSNTTVSCLTAALWLIHPMQLSTVLYPVQRMTELACLFSLLVLIWYLDIRRRLNQDRPLPVFGTIALSVSSLLAVFSKENAALLPLFILLIESYFFKLETASVKQRYYLFALLLVFCLLPVIAGGYYLATHVHATFSGRDFDLYERLLTETHVMVFYLQNIIMPNLSEMSLFLDGFPITRHFDQLTLICCIILLALLGIAVFSYKKAPILSFGLLFYFSGHLMESTVIPLELAFEHRNYLPLYGLVLPIAYYLVNSRILVSSNLKTLAGLLIVLILSITTWLRSEEWSDAMRFYASSVIDQPHSMRASIGMANVLLAQNQLSQARYFIERAERLAPKTAAPVIHHLVTYCATREINRVNILINKATRRIATGLIDSYTIDIVNKLQLLKKDNRCPAVSDEKLIQLTDSLLNNRRRGGPKNKLNLMHARSFNLAGNYTDAISYFRKAISQLPTRDKPSALTELGAVYLALDDTQSASEITEQLKRYHNPPYFDTSRQTRYLESLVRKKQDKMESIANGD